MMRLDKFLTVTGIGSRSENRDYIKRNMVSVNGTIVTKPEHKIDEQGDEICFDGRRVNYKSYQYYLFYKPAGCITANSDATHKTVMDYFPISLRKGLSPVGRLDKDTEGLLLITNDGALNHRLMSPSKHVSKTYYTILDQKVPESAISAFKQGIDIGDDKLTKPAELQILPDEMINEKIRYSAELTLTEGRYHQVKRMFYAVGCEVLYLKRVSIGGLTLNGVKPGEFRELTESEIEGLKNE